MSVEKLKEELSKAIDNGMTNVRVSWGPEAHKLTPDERAAVVLDVLAQGHAYNALTTEQKMQHCINEAYADAKTAMGLLKMPISLDGADNRPSREAISRARCTLDMMLLTLGNFAERDLPNSTP